MAECWKLRLPNIIRKSRSDCRRGNLHLLGIHSKTAGLERIVVHTTPHEDDCADTIMNSFWKNLDAMRGSARPTEGVARPFDSMYGKLSGRSI